VRAWRVSKRSENTYRTVCRGNTRFATTPHRGAVFSGLGYTPPPSVFGGKPRRLVCLKRNY
jgi:hypothetical protein